ncbi:MAG: hypothetical protein ACYCZQ_15815 [Burkholderiales bacterium]
MLPKTTKRPLLPIGAVASANAGLSHRQNCPSSGASHLLSGADMASPGTALKRAAR